MDDVVIYVAGACMNKRFGCRSNEANIAFVSLTMMYPAGCLGVLWYRPQVKNSRHSFYQRYIGFNSDTTRAGDCTIAFH